MVRAQLTRVRRKVERGDYLWRLAFEGGRACNRRGFLLGLTATDARPMLGLSATVLAFSAACLHSIVACSHYLQLTELRSVARQQAAVSGDTSNSARIPLKARGSTVSARPGTAVQRWRLQRQHLVVQLPFAAIAPIHLGTCSGARESKFHILAGCCTRPMRFLCCVAPKISSGRTWSFATEHRDCMSRR